MGLHFLEGTKIPNIHKMVSNWILVDLTRLLNLYSVGVYDSKVTPNKMAQLIMLVGMGSLSASLGKTVLEECFKSGNNPDQIVADNGYTQINDLSVVQQAVNDVIEQNSKAVSDYWHGKESAAKFLMGQVMKLTRGQANPDLANQLILARLEQERVK